MRIFFSLISSFQLSFIIWWQHKNFLLNQITTKQLLFKLFYFLRAIPQTYLKNSLPSSTPPQLIVSFGFFSRVNLNITNLFLFFTLFFFILVKKENSWYAMNFFFLLSMSIQFYLYAGIYFECIFFLFCRSFI